MKRFFSSSWRAAWLLTSTLTAGLVALPAGAEQLFNIATGAQSGTYYPIARAMAAALSEPGVLLVRAQATSGSIANINAIASGQMSSGFSQADIAAWHYTGTGIVKPQFKQEKLRLIANLYPENVHIVVRRALGLQSIAQLKGLNVAIDEPGSGVLVNARQILRAYGLTERDIKPAYIKGAAAAQRMKDGSLDALVYVGGVPSEFIAQLAAVTDITLLPIDGSEAQALRAGDGFFTASNFVPQAYKGTLAVNTLAVGAQWLTTADANDDLVYKLTQNLFRPSVLAQVRASHPNAAGISAAIGAQGAGVPLHPGAERFYREAGVLK